MIQALERELGADIGGILATMIPASTRRHQSIAIALMRQLGNQLQNCVMCEVLGKADYKIDEGSVFQAGYRADLQ